jgi:uncharacterized protein YecT (DUF1311 family)
MISAASAMTFEPSSDGRIIYAIGPIIQGDAARLKKVLDEDPRFQYGALNRAPTLHLQSPGGQVIAGIELANFVRQRGLNTNVSETSECYSACTFVFIGGVKRTILGKFGIHRMSMGGDGKIQTFTDEHLEFIQELTSTLINFAQNLIGDSRMIAAMLTVPARGIEVVRDELLVEWRIITTASRPSQRMKTSFDCGAQGLNEIQHLVCENLVLADSDRRLATAYAWLVDSKKVENAKDEQDRWLKHRDSCRYVVGPAEEDVRLNCVRRAYALRLEQLEGLMSYYKASATEPASDGWQEYKQRDDITRTGNRSQ